jgi:hypothetical protein
MNEPGRPNPLKSKMQLSEAHGVGRPQPAGGPKVAAPPQTSPEPLELEPLEVVEVEDTQEDSSNVTSKIRAFGVGASHVSKEFNRAPVKTGTGACRVKSFHGKLSDQGLGYLDDAINEWLDKHPEVELKFVTSSVGVFEGKIREPALILNLWY